MYFSGIESKDITFDDPNNWCIRINPTLYAEVQNNNERNARVFLDTHLLSIRNQRNEEQSGLERIIAKSDASVSVETRTFIPVLSYVSNAMITAEFNEMSSDEFKESYLAPLDNALRDSNISDGFLYMKYVYPFGDANVEHDIQEYFNEEIARSIKCLYRDISSSNNYFGNPPIFRPPLDRRGVIKPDIVHLLKDLTLNSLTPEICFGIGDYKKKNYQLPLGFEDLKVAINEYKERLSNQRSLRSNSSQHLFSDREWSPRVLCALVLRKYIHQAFRCGTDRVFISDHQSFSGFFRYRIDEGGQMIIDYYIINDPETVAHGITLRSAMAGFFYKDNADALDTKANLAKALEKASKTNISDPLGNVVPRPVEEPDKKRKRSKLSGDELGRHLQPIEENADDDDFGVIRGNTYCRIIYDAAKCYPSLGLNLDSVFVKMYNYPESAIENFPEKDSYYDMFVNELEINKLLGESEYAANFPKLIVSGYCNGIPSKPMHIFEDLDEELPVEKWDNNKVYDTIKLRLEEVHSLGIAHRDVRSANIYVSVTGKISLIDFGLSSHPGSEEDKQCDFKALDQIFDRGTNESIGYDDAKQSVFSSTNKKANEDNDDSNSSDEGVFDKMSESQGTGSSKEEVASKISHK